jgi:hypothetical protein
MPSLVLASSLTVKLLSVRPVNISVDETNSLYKMAGCCCDEHKGDEFVKCCTRGFSQDGVGMSRFPRSKVHHQGKVGGFLNESAVE